MQQDILVVVSSVKPVSSEKALEELNGFIVSTDRLTAETQTSDEAMEKLKIMVESLTEYAIHGKNKPHQTVSMNKSLSDLIEGEVTERKSTKKSKKRSSEIIEEAELFDTEETNEAEPESVSESEIKPGKSSL